jgi:quercetin dioxygenase-like cupin family protein
VQVLSESDANTFTNSENCSGFEFPFNSSQLNIAVVEVNGRYPQTGSLLNEECDEIGYVLSGTGTVGTEDETHEIKAGDAVFIKAGETFWWQGQNLRMLMPCSPPFYPEQHKEVS